MPQVKETSQSAEADERAKIDDLNMRFNGMLKLRASHLARWRDAVQHVSPTRGMFLKVDHNRGDKTRSRILDNTAGRALKTAQAGLLAGMASPSRAWFEMQTNSPKLNAMQPVREWNEEYRDAILGVCERSNYYNSLGQLLGDEVIMATSSMFIFDDPDNIIRCQTFPIGSYVIAQNNKGRVDEWAREYVMTVAQAAAEFGLENLSERAQLSIKAKRYTDEITVRHIVMPRKQPNARKLDTTGLPVAEFYWEFTASGQGSEDTPTRGFAGGPTQGKIMREAGYHEFPIVVARWDKMDTDVWGTDSPVLMALGDIKELQAQRKLYSNALAKIVHPPMNADPSLKNKANSINAGALTFSPDGGGLSPVHEVRLALGEVQAGMADLRRAIQDALMVNLFRTILDKEGVQPLNDVETRAMLQEKADILGPVQERHNDDVFGVAVNRIGAIVLRRSQPLWEVGGDALVSEPPSVLAELELDIQYISDVAQAQKLAALAPIERHTQFVSGFAQIDPTVLDSLDLDEVVRSHADVVGAPERITRSRAEVEQLRAERSRQQQAAALAEQAPALAGAAKDLSDTRVDDKGTSALQSLLSRDEV